MSVRQLGFVLTNLVEAPKQKEVLEIGPSWAVDLHVSRIQPETSNNFRDSAHENVSVSLAILPSNAFKARISSLYRYAQ